MPRGRPKKVIPTFEQEVASAIESRFSEAAKLAAADIAKLVQTRSQGAFDLPSAEEIIASHVANLAEAERNKPKKRLGRPRKKKEEAPVPEKVVKEDPAVPKGLKVVELDNAPVAFEV